MTPEELKARLRAPKTTASCQPCMAGADDDEDLDPKVKFIHLPGEEDDDVTEEEEAADDLWQALMLLNETQQELEKLLEKDRRNDFLSMQEYHDLATLRDGIKDLTEQYTFGDDDDENDPDPSIIVLGR